MEIIIEPILLYSETINIHLDGEVCSSLKSLSRSELNLIESLIFNEQIDEIVVNLVVENGEMRHIHDSMINNLKYLDFVDVARHHEDLNVCLVFMVDIDSFTSVHSQEILNMSD
jgi:hypothetical protein